MKPKDIVRRIGAVAFYLRCTPPYEPARSIGPGTVAEAAGKLDALIVDIEADGEGNTITMPPHECPPPLGHLVQCQGFALRFCATCQIAVLQAKLDTTEAERAGAEARYLAMVMERNVIEGARAEAENRAGRLAEKLDAARLKGNGFAAERDLARKTSDRFADELKATGRQLDALRGSYNQVTYERDCHRSEIDRLSAECRALGRRLEGFGQSTIAEYRTALHQARHELALARAEKTVAQNLASIERIDRRAAEAELEKERRGHAIVYKELDEARAELDAQRRLHLRKELDEARHELALARHELALARTELAALAPLRSILDNARVIFAALSDPAPPADQNQGEGQSQAEAPAEKEAHPWRGF